MSALLQVDGLAKAFGGVHAVQGCTFEVRDGSVTALVGPNGSGKTTVFNLVTGFERADAGTVAYAGRVVRRPDPAALHRAGLTRTFQHARVFGRLSALENLTVATGQRWTALANRRAARATVERARELLADFGLSPVAALPAASLSYGQRKLLEFASVLMAAPRLVLLDEPAAGVNPTVTGRIAEHIGRLNADGTTFLIVEHDMAFVTRLCDTVIVMDAGEVIATGTPADIQRDERVLDAYLGA